MMTGGKLYSDFLVPAIEEINKGNCTAARFVELRYILLGRLYPHEPFSTNQSHYGIFEEMAGYVTGIVPIPHKAPGGEREQGGDDRYWKNYRDWLRIHAKLHMQK